MVWGAIYSTKTLELQFCSNRVKSSDYTADLRSSLIMFLASEPDKNWGFQQDNASIHVSKITEDWMATNSINLLQWSACSQMSYWQ